MSGFNRTEVVMRLWCTLVALLMAVPAHAQRLPTNVKPAHYDITITPDLAAATFAGVVTIRVELQHASQSIVLNAADIEFQEVTIKAAGRTQKAAVKSDEPQQQATFTMSSPIPAGSAEILIRYTGVLNNDLRGLYLSKGKTRRYAATQLEATDARRMFPSFDEPAFKATFALTTVIDKGDIAISNGEITQDASGPGTGKHTVTFATTPRMSTYLVALAVGDFECNGTKTEGIPIRICATPGNKPQLTFALEATGQILAFLNKYYSIDYPFKKLDIVALPDFAAGAMENTAAIFYREELLFADESTPVAHRREVAEVLAHEIAHQWFGDLVTMRWWDDIWLNEGFATWMEVKPVKAWKPDWDSALLDLPIPAFNTDALGTTRALRANATTPAEIGELFDAIAYEKGAAVIRMIEAWVGEEAFRQGVNAYLEKYQYANATAEDFWNVLTKSTGKPVDRVMRSFVDQPGVPLITVDVDCRASRAVVTLRQERYFADSKAGAAVTSPLWNIPVCLRQSTAGTRCEVVDEKTESLQLESCPQWLTANANGAGYYRAALPESMLTVLTSAISKLPVVERVSLLSDEWALVLSDRRPAGSYLDLVVGFGSDRHVDVVSTYAAPLMAINELITGATQDGYRAWMRSFLKPLLDDVGWSGPPNEDDRRAELRSQVVSMLAAARDAAVLAKLRELVDQELAKPGSVPKTLLDTAVTWSAADGETALYDTFLARSVAAGTPDERYRYQYALAAFRDPALVRRTLDLALGPDVRAQDAPRLMALLLEGEEQKRQAAWELVKARWDEIDKKTGEFPGTATLIGALGSACDAKMAEDIKAFFATRKVSGAERTLSQSLERIDACARQRSRYNQEISAWLKAHRTGLP
jgi:puromycin-sensitive aminopeptidase